MPNRALVAVMLAAALAGACTKTTRRTLVPDVPQNGDASARARFQDLRAKFLRDGGKTDRSDEFKEIADDYPDDPVAPFAQLYAGIASVKARKFDDATEELGKVIENNKNPQLVLRAKLYLGIAKNYLGDAGGAVALLVQKDVAAFENEDEKTEYLAALGYATASTGSLTALATLDELYGRVSPTERAVIVGRIEALVATSDPARLSATFEALKDRGGPSVAVAGTRLAQAAADAGRASEAERYRLAAAPARAAVGLPKTADDGGPLTSAGGDSNLIGAVLPLGGKQTRLGEDAIAGLGLAAGAADGKAVTAIEVRSALDAATATAAVEDLAAANVIAVIGPIDGASVDAAGGRAEGLGVPLLSLATRPEERTQGKFVFHIRHSAEARSRILAGRAVGKGVKTFAILAPDSGYGRALTTAFEGEVKKLGGTIVTKVTYPPETKSFASFTGKLGGGWDGVFIPEDAKLLGLITPALAASGKVPKPVGTKKVPGGKPVLLLSTADGLSSNYLSDAGRHSEGALFAPGFYPDDTDGMSKAFVDRFVASFGRPPGASEAYAYDAALVIAAAGTGGRAQLASTLAKAELPGITGAIRFDADHQRADGGVLYTVIEDNGMHVIRVAK